MTEEDTEPLALPDVSVLLALTNASHQHHRRAHEWLAQVDRFAMTPITENGLVRLLLNEKVTGQEVSGARAISIARGLRSDKRARFVPDSSSLVAATVDLVGLGYKQATDFYLVNLAASIGGVLTTFDRRIKQSLTTRDHRHIQVL